MLTPTHTHTNTHPQTCICMKLHTSLLIGGLPPTLVSVFSPPGRHGPIKTYLCAAYARCHLARSIFAIVRIRVQTSFSARTTTTTSTCGQLLRIRNPHFGVGCGGCALGCSPPTHSNRSITGVDYYTDSDSSSRKCELVRMHAGVSTQPLSAKSVPACPSNSPPSPPPWCRFALSLSPSLSFLFNAH